MNRCSLSAPEQSSTELERAVLRTKLNYAKSSFWGFLSKKNGIDAISNKMYTNFKSHCPVVVMLIECHHFFLFTQSFSCCFTAILTVRILVCWLSNSSVQLSKEDSSWTCQSRSLSHFWRKFPSTATVWSNMWSSCRNLILCKYL